LVPDLMRDLILAVMVSFQSKKWSNRALLSMPMKCASTSTSVGWCRLVIFRFKLRCFRRYACCHMIGRPYNGCRSCKLFL
jgi:hypothetical protein